MPFVETSGRFVPRESVLYYEHGGSVVEIAPERILSIGEATTGPGTSGEDWFLCFVIDAHGSWIETSMYAQGRNDALQWLSARFGRSFELKLANAPPFRSRVMWPARLQEQPLFVYDVPLPYRVFGRALGWLGVAPPDAVQSVHPGVLEYLRGGR